jgi:uncharacterized protein YneF (UPF0154 family)
MLRFKQNINTLRVALLFCSLYFSTSRLSVLSPQVLGDEFAQKYTDGIPYTLADFGQVYYGQSLIGYTFLADPIDACLPLNNDPVSAREIPTIILATRGNCSYTQKALNTQANGGILLVIMDYNSTDDVASKEMKPGEGSKDVEIPTIMIAKEDGDMITNYVNGSDFIVNLALSFPLPKAESVIFNFWMSSVNKHAFTFLKEFYKQYQGNEDLIEFIPDYHSFELNENGTLQNNTHCLSGGRYCAEDPDGDGNQTGKDVLIEDIRQLCIWKQSPEQWWQYVLAFADDKACLKLNATAIQKITTAVGINSQNIQNCYEASFEDTDPNTADNSYLKDEKSKMSSLQTHVFPAATINDASYKGNFNHVGTVMTAICAGFYTQPDMCAYGGASDEDSSSSGGAIAAIVISSVLGVVFIMSIGFYFHRRAMKREFQQEMNMKLNNLSLKYGNLQEEKEKSQVTSTELTSSSFA